MEMNLGELIAALTELQTVAGENAPTSVRDLKLKSEIQYQHDKSAYGYAARQPAPRKREFSVWVESYRDGPEPGAGAAVEYTGRGIEFDPSNLKC